MTADRPPIAVLVDREGLGDVMLKTPFLRALRRAFPDHEVWWIATHQSAMEELSELLAPAVTKVITHAALDGPIRPLLGRLRALPAFDLVFDSRTKISTVAITRLALKHHGFYCCLPGYVLCDGQPPARRSRPRHIGERMLSLVGCATGRAPDGSGRLHASVDAATLARQALPDGRGYVGIAPGSRAAEKNWPLAGFCQVARALIEHGLSPVFFLGPMEQATAVEIQAAAPSAIVLTGQGMARGDLDRLIAQGQRLTLLLANDNGVGHLLGAAGVPVVSLFGPTDPARWRPITPLAHTLRAADFGAGHIGSIPASAVIEAVFAMARRVEATQVPPAMKS
jgi:ADP-heptose:LPS heptosyltransferase